MKIAVNIMDLADCFPVSGLVGMLLADFVDRRITVETEKGKLDGHALILDGPAADDLKRLEGLVSFLQTVLGPRKIRRPVRCYRQGPRGGWKKITSERR